MTRSKNIYLVDDDTSARRGLSKLLAAAGYKVEAFSSVEDFFQYQSIDEPACLILDAGVSGLSEIDLQTRLFQKKITIPVIFISGRDDADSRDRALESRAAGFFRKPVDGTALLDAITWAIASHYSESSG